MQDRNRKWIGKKSSCKRILSWQLIQFEQWKRPTKLDETATSLIQRIKLSLIHRSQIIKEIRIQVRVRSDINTRSAATEMNHSRRRNTNLRRRPLLSPILLNLRLQKVEILNLNGLVMLQFSRDDQFWRLKSLWSRVSRSISALDVDAI